MITSTFTTNVLEDKQYYLDDWRGTVLGVFTTKKGAEDYVTSLIKTVPCYNDYVNHIGNNSWSSKKRGLSIQISSMKLDDDSVVTQ